MKGYKAFEKGMICRGKQYRENTVFEEDAAEICKRGMHFCKYPLDVLEYYPLVDEKGNISVFAEVEALGEAKTDDEKKYCTERLKIGNEITFAELVQASIDCKFEGLTEIKTKKCDKDNKKICNRADSARIGSSWYGARIGSSGDSAQIGSSGYGAHIGSSGYGAHIGSSGDSAQIGSSGNSAHIGSSGDCARIGSSGNSAQIGSSGDSARISSEGKNSVVCCAGANSWVKAKKGSWITLSEWGNNDEGEYVPIFVRTTQVDGETIKEDTFYRLENGEFVEVED